MSNPSSAYLSLACNEHKLELTFRVASCCTDGGIALDSSDIRTILEKLHNYISGDNISLDNVYIKTGDKQDEVSEAIKNAFIKYFNDRDGFAKLMKKLKEYSNKLIRCENDRCVDDRRLGRLRYLLDTCYDEQRAKKLAEALEKLGEKLSRSGDANIKMCKAALLLLAYYLAIIKAERKYNSVDEEKWVWLGDLLRAYVDREPRRAIKLCPWEGDVAALAYAALYYCCKAACQERKTGVNATVRVQRGHAGNAGSGTGSATTGSDSRTLLNIELNVSVTISDS